MFPFFTNHARVTDRIHKLQLWCYVKSYFYFTEEENKDKSKEEDIGDLDQLLRIERLKEQKRKDEAEALEPEEEETQVI